MNILEINKFYYPIRGAQKHFLDVVDLFESYGHVVAVFAMEHSENIPNRFSKYFVSYVGFNADNSTLWQRVKGIGRIFWSFEARKKVKELLKEFRPDVVHIHNVYHQLSPSILGPIKKLGVPIIMTVHDYNLISPDKDRYCEYVGREYWKFLFVKKYGLFKRLLLVVKMYYDHFTGMYEQSIDLYIAPSQYVKNKLVSSGIRESKVTVIPHFILESDNLTLLSEHSEPRSSRYALYFGGVSEDKGVSGLITLFDALKIPLVIAGHLWGGYTLPQSQWMTYVGPKTKEELRELIGRSECVVSGSELPETFGLIALEAMMYGKPFFGLKSGAYEEIVVNNENGFLADNYADLGKVVTSFFSGGKSFRAEKIREDIFARYGSDRYYDSFRGQYEVIKNRMLDEIRVFQDYK